MKLQRIFSCITGVFIAVGFAASQANAGVEPPVCDFVIEINALRGGSPTVSAPGTKDITAKARIAKGTAVDGTTIDTQLRIEARDGSTGNLVGPAQFAGPIRLGVGRGGQGAKLRMPIDSCDITVKFTATFSGLDDDGDQCTASRSIIKTCK
jgi:hypothetical protein